MTEEEWLTAAAAIRMFEFVSPAASERKLRLAICDAVRRDPTAQSMNARRSVELGDRLADGQLSAAELTAFNRKTRIRQGSQWLALTTNPPATLRLIVRSTGDELAPHLPPLFRDVFGNPFRPVELDPSWLTSTVVALAEGIYAEKAFDRMPILADALQDAGCDSDALLNHCRDPLAAHVRGCWAVDLLTGRS